MHKLFGVFVGYYSDMAIIIFCMIANFLHRKNVYKFEKT